MSNPAVLAAAKAHFKDVLAGGLKGPIRVPEWKADIYYKAATSFQQESKIVELTSQGKTVEALIEALIMRALDEDGNAIFQKADKPELMRSVDPTIIMRIMSEMNDPDNQTKIDTVLGN
jgi:hypothetical protein